MMTRKDFEALATSLASVRPVVSDLPYVTDADARYLGWQCAVTSVADVCERSNVRFDRERFVSACNDRPSDF